MSRFMSLFNLSGEQVQLLKLHLDTHKSPVI